MGVFKLKNPPLEQIFPIGSLYFTTATICPLQKLGVGTWVKVAGNLTIATSANISVKGNGIQPTMISSGSYARTGGLYAVRDNALAVDATVLTIGNSAEGSGGVYGVAKFSTDANKSGLTGSTSLSNLTVNIFQRTA